MWFIVWWFYIIASNIYLYGRCCYLYAISLFFFKSQIELPAGLVAQGCLIQIPVQVVFKNGTSKLHKKTSQLCNITIMCGCVLHWSYLIIYILHQLLNYCIRKVCSSLLECHTCHLPRHNTGYFSNFSFF